MTTNQHDIDQQSAAGENGQLKTAVEVRQGVKTRHVRWMLAASLALGVAALGGAYVWYTSAQPPASATTAAADRPTNG